MTTFTPARDLKTTPSWGRRLKGIEGLRGIAAVTVLLGHVRGHLAENVDLGIGNQVMGALANGLVLFFALSGFLLFRPFVFGIVGSRPFPSVTRFLANRAIRVFPAYVVIFLLVSFVLGLAFARPVGPTDGLSGSENAVGYISEWQLVPPNLVMLQTFFPFSMKTGLSVAWTLSVELVFYLLLPVLAVAAWKLARGSRHQLLALIMPAIMVLATGIGGKLIYLATFHPSDATQAFFLNWGGNWYAVFARSFLRHGDLFAFGMIAAVIVVLFELGKIRPRLLRPVRIASLSVALVLGVGALRIPLGVFGDTAFAAAFGAVIVIVALPPSSSRPHGWLARCLDFVPVRYVGLISFSIYLWHDPLIFGLKRLGWVGPETPTGFLISCGSVLLATLTLSTLTYFFVERPPLRLKRRADSGPLGVTQPVSSRNT